MNLAPLRRAVSAGAVLALSAALAPHAVASPSPGYRLYYKMPIALDETPGPTEPEVPVEPTSDAKFSPGTTLSGPRLYTKQETDLTVSSRVTGTVGSLEFVGVEATTSPGEVSIAQTTCTGAVPVGGLCTTTLKLVSPASGRQAVEVTFKTAELGSITQRYFADAYDSLSMFTSYSSDDSAGNVGFNYSVAVRPRVSFYPNPSADLSSARYSATGLPPGMAIDSVTGVVSGTPTLAGIFEPNLTVKYEDFTYSTAGQPFPVFPQHLSVTSMVPGIGQTFCALDASLRNKVVCSYSPSPSDRPVVANTEIAAKKLFGMPQPNSGYFCYVSMTDELECANSFGEVTSLGLSNASDIGRSSARVAGAAYYWGYDSTGIVAGTYPSGAGPTYDKATLVSGFSYGVTKVVQGSEHICAIQSGRVKCMGGGGRGQIGGRLNNVSATPIEIPLTYPGILDLAAGDEHTCAVESSGAVKCWGANYYRQLGNGSSADTPTPVAVQGIPPMAKVFAGGSMSCGVTSSREVWCWGTYATAPLYVTTLVTINDQVIPVKLGTVCVSSPAGGSVQCHQNPTSGGATFSVLATKLRGFEYSTIFEN